MKIIYTSMKKMIIILFVLMLAGSGIYGQQLSSFQLFHMNRYLHNPASAGTTPYIFVSTSYAQKWSGFPGAPNMQCVNAHALISERVGFGGKIFYENTGLSGQFGAEATYAYHIPVGDGGNRLSFGLSALLSQYNLQKDKFNVAHPDDEVITMSENSMIVPDAAFGISFYRNHKFFINYSVYQLFDRDVNFINADYLNNKRVRHHFINLGYRFNFSEDVKLEVSTLAKLTESGMNQVDVGAKAEIKGIFAFGAYYKTNEAIAPYIGFDTKYFVFGYSYGINISDISDYTVGSHEIMLILKIKNSKPSL